MAIFNKRIKALVLITGKLDCLNLLPIIVVGGKEDVLSNQATRRTDTPSGRRDGDYLRKLIIMGPHDPMRDGWHSRQRMSGE